MNCRHCGSHLSHSFIDLGFSPPSNAYLTQDDLSRPEKYYPLNVKVCDQCWLVQTEDYAERDEFFSADYAYFSSTSSSWLAHAREYTDLVIEKFHLNQNSFVVEIASNDGYLLRNFVSFGIPCLGIEPTESTAVAAENLGVPVLRDFFGETLGVRIANEHGQADLIIGNNVYAHVPDINDFTRGMKEALKSDGVITLEFPHLMRLIERHQFDTIYHEHFSYLSLFSVCRIFDSSGLKIWHVDELPTHGGSLRIYACHKDNSRQVTESVDQVLEEERRRGLQTLQTYTGFQDRANNIKNRLLEFLIQKKKDGETVVAYGAAAKGNTILNYAGVKSDLLPVVFDAAEAKQGKYMPGSHIPILPTSKITDLIPDYVLILPWNIFDEIIIQLRPKLPSVRFVVAVPELKTYD